MNYRCNEFLLLMCFYLIGSLTMCVVVQSVLYWPQTTSAVSTFALSGRIPKKAVGCHLPSLSHKVNFKAKSLKTYLKHTNALEHKHLNLTSYNTLLEDGARQPRASIPGCFPQSVPRSVCVRLGTTPVYV